MYIPLITSLLRQFRHRREVHSLVDLDEHILTDIGLLRTDVYAALTRPVIDPSKALASVCCHWRSFTEGLRPTPRTALCCA